MFEGVHTSERIAEKIQEIIKRYLIENKVAYIISDSASNMIKGKKSNVEIKKKYRGSQKNFHLGK